MVQVSRFDKDQYSKLLYEYKCTRRIDEESVRTRDTSTSKNGKFPLAEIFSVLIGNYFKVFVEIIHVQFHST